MRARKTHLDLRIVGAAAQDLWDPPTESSVRLLPLLSSEISSTDVVLPAALHMLRKSSHYTLAVESALPPIPETLKACFLDAPAAASVFRPCAQAVALVETSQASRLEPTEVLEDTASSLATSRISSVTLRPPGACN